VSKRTEGGEKVREIFFGMLLILLSVQSAAAGTMEDPYAALQIANKHPNALIFHLASDRANYVLGDEVYLTISLQNVSKETVYFWQYQPTENFRLKILSQNGTPLDAVWDRPLFQNAPHARRVSPGGKALEYGAHGETLIPVSQWGYHDLPRGTYFLTLEYTYYKNGTVTSNTIQITVN
jgi:hypothetical protein